MMFGKGNRSCLAPLSVLFLLILIALAACQATSDDATSELQADLAVPTNPVVPTEEPTELPAPTEEPTSTPVPTEAPPTAEPTPELQAPTKERSSTPPARGGHAMAYDSESDRIIMFGGELEREWSHNNGETTWAYDAGNNLWNEMRPEIEPLAVQGLVMAYDSESDRIVMHGGWTASGVKQNLTWIYDYNTNSWSEASAGPRVGGAGMVYDSESDRMILFGDRTLPETWTYDVNTDTWEKMEPIVSPPARSWHNMVYDVESDRVILWEGYEAPDESVWAYDYNANTWSQLPSEGAPSIAFFEGFGAMVYDSESDRSVSYGGGFSGSLTKLDDLWIYDYNTNTWTKMEPDAGPGKRMLHAMAYDPALDLVVLFGGLLDGTQRYNQETWVYDLNTNTWTNRTIVQD
jgi:hypothetical protein